jgi:hypothetical protein
MFGLSPTHYANNKLPYAHPRADHAHRLRRSPPRGFKNFDQKKLAAHWLAKQDWFSDQLARTCQIEADLKIIRVPVSEASEALMRIIEVCQKHCELYL